MLARRVFARSFLYWWLLGWAFRGEGAFAQRDVVGVVVVSVEHRERAVFALAHVSDREAFISVVLGFAWTVQNLAHSELYRRIVSGLCGGRASAHLLVSVCVCCSVSLACGVSARFRGEDGNAAFACVIADSPQLAAVRIEEDFGDHVEAGFDVSDPLEAAVFVQDVEVDVARAFDADREHTAVVGGVGGWVVWLAGGFVVDFVLNEPGVRDPGEAFDAGVSAQAREVGCEVPLFRGFQLTVGIVDGWRGEREHGRAGGALVGVVAFGAHEDAVRGAGCAGHGLGIRGSGAVSVLEGERLQFSPAVSFGAVQAQQRSVAVFGNPQVWLVATERAGRFPEQAGPVAAGLIGIVQWLDGLPARPRRRAQRGRGGWVRWVSRLAWLCRGFFALVRGTLGGCEGVDHLAGEVWAAAVGDRGVAGPAVGQDRVFRDRVFDRFTLSGWGVEVHGIVFTEPEIKPWGGTLRLVKHKESVAWDHGAFRQNIGVAGLRGFIIGEDVAGEVHSLAARVAELNPVRVIPVGLNLIDNHRKLSGFSRTCFRGGRLCCRGFRRWGFRRGGCVRRGEAAAEREREGGCQSRCERCRGQLPRERPLSGECFRGVRRSHATQDAVEAETAG